MDSERNDILKKSIETSKKARNAAEKKLKEKTQEVQLLRNELKEIHSKFAEITTQKKCESAGIFENINDGYICMDLSGNVIKMNGIAIDFFGYDIHKEKLTVSDLIHPDDLEYGTKSFKTLFKEGVFTNYRTRALTKDKRIKWVQVNGNLIMDAGNKPIGAQGIIRDITSDKQDEELRTESENRLASLILNLDYGVLLEDENGKITLTNTKFCELFKTSTLPDSLKGMESAVALGNVKELFQKPEEFIARVQSISENKQAVIGEEITMVDGTILERDFTPVLQGELHIGQLWSYKVITLREQYRKSLEAQKLKYSNIIENMNLGLIEVNKADEILMVNQSFIEMSGSSRAELLGKKGKASFELVNDIDRIKIENDKRHKGESSSYEIKIRNKEGGIRNLLISGAPNYDINGKIIGSIGIHLDTTEVKRKEELVEQIKYELDTIVHNSSMGIVLTNRGRIIKTNVAIQSMLGYTELELRNLSINDLFSPEDYASFKTYIRQINMQDIDSFVFTKRYKKKDGSGIWTKTNVNIVRDKNRKIKHQVVFIEDITSAIEKTFIIDLINNLTKSILDKTDITEIAWEIVNNIAGYLDSDDCVIYLVDNEKEIIEQIAVYGDKLAGKKKIINKLVLAKGKGIVGSVATSGVSEIIKDTSKDPRYIMDQERRFSEIAVPIMSNGKAIGVIDSEHKQKNHYTTEHVKTLESIASLVAIKLRTAISIRERKKVETRNEQLLEKLEKSNNELDEYAHTVSHDLKTPLQSIEALVSWIKSDNIENLDAISLKNISLIEDTLETMNQLITNILKYSIAGTVLYTEESVDLNALLGEIKNVLVIPEKLTITILSNLPMVKGDKTKFQQLFQNLIGNAIKFNKKENGTVEIDCIEKDSFYQFSVKDNGIGIEKKYHDKIFKIFHSLNKNKESTGIGLSIVKKIVNLYDGEIWLESSLNVGSTFYFTLKK
ncbi:PAS domain S-box protein [uncultured Polaribacter sp.]|uniref:PAS domain S-box protein n=1 Tax=uncultured Polaribacter sp. TaxID=174711 RepID=UPI0032B2BB15|tara:strand:+ start:5323 stop:8184 length:2862 start_codon:yes stop_codon:yes gene_type:complete